jgi:hypothetical protein
MKYMPRHTAFGKLKAMSDAAAMVRKEISQAANVLAHHAPTNCQGFQFSNSCSNACNTVIASEAKQSMEQPQRMRGLLRRGACHRARIRATRWLLAMTVGHAFALSRRKTPETLKALSPKEGVGTNCPSSKSPAKFAAWNGVNTRVNATRRTGDPATGWRIDSGPIIKSEGRLLRHLRHASRPGDCPLFGCRFNRSTQHRR